jgi:hypothetical protein
VIVFVRFRARHFQPVSTTHAITGSIIGVGLTKRVSAVRWGVTVSLLWAWVLTIPISSDFSSNYLLCSKYLYLETIVKKAKPSNYEWLLLYYYFFVTCSKVATYAHSWFKIDFGGCFKF